MTTALFGTCRGGFWAQVSSLDGCLFSVPGDAERRRQVQGGLVERQAVHGRPEVQDVALSSTLGLKTLKDLLAQVRGKRSGARALAR